MMRVTLPLFYAGMNLERVFFAVLVYELAAQFILTEWLKKLIEGKIRVLILTIFFLATLPLQYVAWCVSGELFGWQLTAAELICLLTGGGARILSAYTLRAVSQGATDVLFNLNLLIIFVGAMFVFVPYLYLDQSIAPLVILQTFFAIELMIGLFIIFRHEILNVGHGV